MIKWYRTNSNKKQLLQQNGDQLSIQFTNEIPKKISIGERIGTTKDDLRKNIYQSIDDSDVLQDEEDISDNNLKPVVPKINHNEKNTIPDETLKFVDILLQIYYDKVIEYAKNNWNILSEWDAELCFELACKEYVLLYPDGWKKNDNIIRQAEKMI